MTRKQTTKIKWTRCKAYKPEIKKDVSKNDIHTSNILVYTYTNETELRQYRQKIDNKSQQKARNMTSKQKPFNIK